MSDNPGEMYQHCTVTEVPLIASFTEIKDYQATSTMPRFGITSLQEDDLEVSSR